MAYTLINIESGEIFICEDNVWIDAFEAAKADGWDPDGTMYDAAYTLDEELDYIGDDNEKLWRIYTEVGNEFDWDGSYTEKRGQVVTYGDSYYMVMSLKCAGADPALCEFVSKGSFRIC